MSRPNITKIRLLNYQSLFYVVASEWLFCGQPLADLSC